MQAEVRVNELRNSGWIEKTIWSPTWFFPEGQGVIHVYIFGGGVVLPSATRTTLRVHHRNSGCQQLCFFSAWELRGAPYLCVHIHCPQLKLCDGLPHTLLHTHASVLHKGQWIIHRVNRDGEGLCHLEAVTGHWGTFLQYHPCSWHAWLPRNPGMNLLGLKPMAVRGCSCTVAKSRRSRWSGISSVCPLPSKENRSTQGWTIGPLTSCKPSDSTKLKASDSFPVPLEWTYWTFREVRSAWVKELIWMPKERRREEKKGCQKN